MKSEGEELQYLQKTIDIINKNLKNEEKEIKFKIKNVISSRKEMWQENVHFSDDFDRIPEMNQYLSEVNKETVDYISRKNKINKYKKMIKSPYFGRFDFLEKDSEDLEKIYVGAYSLMDDENDEILVYDWRAPICSIFYRCENGKGSYVSPVGTISGDVLLKRQYKIQNSKLNYYFDSNVFIGDKILQEVLSQNSSSNMRSIIQTIQKDQDVAIRDTENELLIIQGVVGSGKTSIALHRIAYLLYEGLENRITNNDVIIISPNVIFGKYISSVLPELGEKSVREITFDDIADKLLEKRFLIEKRHEQLDNIISSQGCREYNVKLEGVKFKGSQDFVKLMDKLIKYAERSYIQFKDVYYDGKIIETKDQLENFFLNNKTNMPVTKRLKRIENMIFNKVHSLRKVRLAKIEKVVAKAGNHPLEIKSFSRLLAIREARVFSKNLKSFTEIDYFDLYKLIFENEELFMRLSKGIQLPENIEYIIERTKDNIRNKKISYEDCAPLLYLKIKLEGNNNFEGIKQVVIDEAQDYYPIQYEVFKSLFKNARYTILGDFNQTLEKSGDVSIYNTVQKILNKKKSAKIFLNKSYRSSLEINEFSKRILDSNATIEPFERHEQKPKVIYEENLGLMDEAIAEEIKKFYSEGYETIAIICKTIKAAKVIKENLKKFIKVEVLDNADMEFNEVPVVVAAHLSKGLEFDVVILYDVSENNYKTEFDRKLIYISCTRALHRLELYYTGNRSKFIK
ncbi:MULTISPECIES: HelD family protein [Clostridium]|uniref:HelD family protein n=1 Tax=Clostridium TaxID=1485 RepID=UPI00082411B9|nr:MULTISPECIES: UvrD-helicase domain-containing protein [Clostridium]PJI08640.1 ATP-dependent DNA helicase [Clostridium sp. CT7]